MGQSTVSRSSHQRSVGLGCYKWYQNNPAIVADYCSVHLAREKILKLRSDEDVVFLTGGECDTPD